MITIEEKSLKECEALRYKGELKYITYKWPNNLKEGLERNYYIMTAEKIRAEVVGTNEDEPGVYYFFRKKETKSLVP